MFDAEAEIDRIRAKPKPALKERSVQVSLKRYLETVLPACEVVAIKNEHATRSDDKLAIARFHAKRKAEGVKAGAPDLMVVRPRGGVFFVEVKRPGGVVSDAQRDLHQRWRGMGQTVIVADSIESLRLGLHSAGIATLDGSREMRAPKVRGMGA